MIFDLDALVEASDADTELAPSVETSNLSVKGSQAFWRKLLDYAESQTDLFKGISTTDHHWLGKMSALSGLSWNFVIVMA